MEFDKKNLKDINEKVVKAVEDVLKDTGISVQFGGGRYTDLEYKLKLTLTTKSEDGLNPAEKDFIDYGINYGLEPQMLGATINISGKSYKIAGLYPNRKKNNVSLINVKNGKSYIASHTRVKDAYFEINIGERVT